MDKSELIKSLANMFNDEKEEKDYIIEEKQLDKTTYLSLVKKYNDNNMQTHPDYEALISILKYYNTKTLNYVVMRLNENKRKFFVEYSDSEKEKFLNDVRDLYERFIGANSKALPFLESMILEWMNNLLKQ